jgi:hypothetical protein
MELYEYHDKYTFVGVLAADPVDEVVERALLEEATLLGGEGEGAERPLDVDGQIERGGELYREGKVSYQY